MPTLHWIGKDKVINHHLDVPYKVLDHQYGFDNGSQTDEDTKSGNKIIHGDNLEALKSLLPEYEGKIKCIYIDPPYNTGNEGWVYNDNVNDPKITKWLNSVVGKEGEDLSRHDKWLCMMYPRVRLLHKLLSEDGVIFISIDDNEYSNLKLITDEIFGYSNSIGPIIQNKMNAKNDTINIQKNHEFLLAYRKKASSLNGSKIIPSLIKQEYEIREVSKEGDEFYYINDAITTRGEGGILNARPNLGFTVYYNPATKDKQAVCDYNIELAKISNNVGEIYTADPQLIANGYQIIRPPKVRGKLGCWTWSLEKFNNEKKDIIITGKPSSYAVKKRTFVDKNEVFEELGKYFYKTFVQGNSRSIIDFSTNEGTNELNDIMETQGIFDNPKNVEMLKYILSLIPDKNSIILDSFAGSGTTAQAVLELNKKDGGKRNFICVEMEEYAETITAERTKRVITGYNYVGKVKETLDSYPVNITTLKRADSILKEVAKYKLTNSHDDIKVEYSDGKIAITGVKEVSGKMEGLGGKFDYYKLGQSLFNETGELNEVVGIEKLRTYIYYTETNLSLTKSTLVDNEYHLDIFNQTSYYFYYQKDNLTSLDDDFLSTIKNKAEQYIIYADNCLLNSDFMKKQNIIFKKIPRDISKF